MNKVAEHLLDRAEIREVSARQAGEVVERLEDELTKETCPDLKASLRARIAVRKADQANDLKAAKIYRLEARKCKG